MHKSLNISIVFALFALLSQTIHAQTSQLAIGQWQSHQSFSEITSICQTSEHIIAAGKSDILLYHKTDHTISTYDKTSVLSNSEISAIGFEEKTQLLVVGYEDGIIDLVYPNETITLTDLKRANATVLKRINRIRIIDNQVFLCTNVGVLKIDPEKSEISETFRIAESYFGNGTLDISKANNRYYIASESGIYSASVSNAFLNQFSSWQADSLQLSGEKRFNSLVNLNGRLIANFSSSQENGDLLYTLENDVWVNLPIIGGYNSRALQVVDNKLIVAGWYEGIVYNENLEFEFRTNRLDGAITFVNDVTYFNNQLFLATQQKGIVYGNQISDNQQILPNAPYRNNALQVSIDQGTVVVSSGALDATYNNTFTQNGIYVRQDGFWSNINKSQNDFPQNDFDFVSSAIDPNDPTHIYTNSWGGGLIEIKDGKVVEKYTPENSILQYHALRSDNFIPNIAAKFDNKGVLWFLNPYTSAPLIRKEGNNWSSYSVEESQSNGTFIASDLAFRTDNTVWMAMPRGGGVQVFGHNNTFDNTSDDQFKNLTATPGRGGLPSNTVFCVEEDLDGQIWVGTNEGFAIFSNPDGIFDSDNYDATQPIIEQDGNFEIILGTEQINNIKVDGGNRKWMATQSSGAFLLDKTGYTVLEHFTTENSPLLSNTIYDIGIDDLTGEVYFATAKGLQSFRGTSTKSVEKIDAIASFPNPVRPDYQGVITITGLIRDANVKITDVSGRLIFETTAEGGQATWNGLTLNGEKPPMGVYLVFATTTDGEEAGSGKLMFLR